MTVQVWHSTAPSRTPIPRTCRRVQTGALSPTVAHDVCRSMLRGFAVRGLQKTVPVEAHGRTVYHLVDEKDSSLKELHLNSVMTGYARLIGPDGKMHWLVQGPPSRASPSSSYLCPSPPPPRG